MPAEHSIRGNGNKGKRMEKELSNSQMGQDLKVIGKKTKWKGMGSTSGRMEIDLKGFIKRGSVVAKDNTTIAMGISMMGFGNMTRNTAMEYLPSETDRFGQELSTMISLKVTIPLLYKPSFKPSQSCMKLPLK
jgi:hypothetical protein